MHIKFQEIKPSGHAQSSEIEVLRRSPKGKETKAHRLSEAVLACTHNLCFEQKSENSKKNSTENCHIYIREKSLYVAWACFRNVVEKSRNLSLTKFPSNALPILSTEYWNKTLFKKRRLLFIISVGFFLV